MLECCRETAFKEGQMSYVSDDFWKHTKHNTAWQRKIRDVGIMSMLEDLAGDAMSTLRTSSAVTGDSVLSVHPW